MRASAETKSCCPYVPSGPCPLRGTGGGSGCAVCHDVHRIRILKRSAYLFTQGEPCAAFYAVMRGVIALDYVDDDGGITILRLVQGGELLGCADFFDGHENRTSARIIEDAVVCALSREAVADAIEADAAFAFRLLKAAAAESHALGLFAQRMACMPVEARLLALLGELSAGREVFTLPVSKRDLAFMAGTSPEVLSRTLVKLRRQGLLVTERNVVTLLREAPAPARTMLAC